MVAVFITLGSNIDPHRNLQAAIDLLAQEAEMYLIRISRVYQSPAVGPHGEINPDQDDFFNAAVLVETDLPIPVFKRDILRRIEADLGRVRTQDKFAPRPIDLDIVLYGDEILGLVIEDLDGGKEIVFPDPDITRFAHIALPIADLDPDYIHPVTRETLAQIAARFAELTSIRLAELDLTI